MVTSNKVSTTFTVTSVQRGFAEFKCSNVTKAKAFSVIISHYSHNHETVCALLLS